MQYNCNSSFAFVFVFVFGIRWSGILLSKLLFSFSFLLNSSANIFRQLLVATHAHRFAFPFVDVTFLQRFVAASADKVVLMIHFVKEMNGVVNHRTSTLSARSAKELSVVSLAVWFAVIFIEVAARERFVADEADKVLRMPHFGQCSYRSANNWFVARGTDVSEQLVEVFCAVEFAFILVAVASSEFTTTFLAAVVFWMESLAIESDVFSYDWFLTLCTYFCLGSNSLLSGIFASSAINLSFVLFVSKTNEVLSTTSASEVVRMIFVTKSSDALVGDCLLAVCTARAK